MQGYKPCFWQGFVKLYKVLFSIRLLTLHPGCRNCDYMLYDNTLCDNAAVQTPIKNYFIIRVIRSLIQGFLQTCITCKSVLNESYGLIQLTLIMILFYILIYYFKIVKENIKYLCYKKL